MAQAHNEPFLIASTKLHYHSEFHSSCVRNAIKWCIDYPGLLHQMDDLKQQIFILSQFWN